MTSVGRCILCGLGALRSKPGVAESPSAGELWLLKCPRCGSYYADEAILNADIPDEARQSAREQVRQMIRSGGDPVVVPAAGGIRVTGLGEHSAG